jgi:hypothetical protein
MSALRQSGRKWKISAPQIIAKPQAYRDATGIAFYSGSTGR